VSQKKFLQGDLYDVPGRSVPGIARLHDCRFANSCFLLVRYSSLVKIPSSCWCSVFSLSVLAFDAKSEGRFRRVSLPDSSTGRIPRTFQICGSTCQPRVSFREDSS
jgi:hypothetical protein